MTDRSAEQVETLPLFPLASVALFPRVRILLHVFEPRYRQMIAIARCGTSRIGMVTAVPDQIDAMAADPAIFPIGCAGQITSCKQRTDGTYDVVLMGACRFRIERELGRAQGQLFRTAQVAILADDESEVNTREVALLRARVHQCYSKLLSRLAPSALEDFHSRGLASIPDEVYANTISLSLNLDSVEKQSLLEASSTMIRLERLLAVLAFKLADPQTRSFSNPTVLQ